jgi:hypothetical protein
MIIDPDKKATKRGLFRTIFSPFMGANARRARLAHRDLKDARAKLAEQRSVNRSVKQLRKDGVLK